MFITPFAPEAAPQPTRTATSNILHRKDTTAWEDLNTCGWYSGTSSRPYVCASPLTCSTDTDSVVGCVTEGMAQLYTSCLDYRDVRLGRCSSVGLKTGCCEDEAQPDCGTFIWTGSPTRYMFKCFTETTTIAMLDEPQFVVDASKASESKASASMDSAASTSSSSLILTVIPVPHTSTTSDATGTGTGTGTGTRESSTSSSLVLTVIPVTHTSSSETTSTDTENPSPTILASSFTPTTPISSLSAPADSPSPANTFPASNTGTPTGLSTATKAGIGAGVGAGVMLILLLALFSPFLLKKAKRRKQPQGEDSVAPAQQQQEGEPAEACHGKAELEDPGFLKGQLQSGGYQGKAELDGDAAASRPRGICGQCGSGTGSRNGGGAAVSDSFGPAEVVELDGSPVVREPGEMGMGGHRWLFRS
ncbi:hypothetical protein VP1G_06132 [Cytospora mali]|uniref:Uncharacterized protein n=1 Tax=Cytospora mali TaxID=578113 RepID=A0A194V4L0_CYTMA|nr:hypothetical protein VP1G_06132 [Valsa mali var. pyri (nom. inval.)]